MSVHDWWYRYRLDLASLLLFAAQLGLSAGIAWWLFDAAGLLLAAALFAGAWFLMPGGGMARVPGRPVGPYDAPQLTTLVARLSAAAGLPAPPEIRFVAGAGPNAAALERLGRPSLIVTGGLLANLSPRELRGVLAHEVSHLAHRDLAWMRLTGLASWIGTALLGIGLVLSLGHPVLLLALLGAMPVQQVLAAALSRQREFAADLGAARLTGDPEGLASALWRISHRPPSLWERLLGYGPQPLPETGDAAFRSHPATDERIRRLLG